MAKFTKSLAQSLTGRGIRVNCVAPGPVWTPLNVSEKEASKVAQEGQNANATRGATAGDCSFVRVLRF